MAKTYETRDKAIKRFTLLVILSFVITMVWSSIVVFISSPEKEKRNDMKTNYTVKEIASGAKLSWSLIVTWNDK